MRGIAHNCAELRAIVEFTGLTISHKLNPFALETLQLTAQKEMFEIMPTTGTYLRPHSSSIVSLSKANLSSSVKEI